MPLNPNQQKEITQAFASLCLHDERFKEYFCYETYKTAQTILNVNDAIENFGIVVDGILKAERYSMNGNELISAYFEDNDVFPEFLYFTGRKTYSYNLVAVKRTQVAWIPVALFEKILEENDEMMYSFMLYMSKRGLTNQLLLNCMNYQTIEERIAYWLIGMHDLSLNKMIKLPRSQTMWANMLHVSRSSLNQELKRMEKEGYFKVDGHYLMLIDEKRLEEML